MQGVDGFALDFERIPDFLGVVDQLVVIILHAIDRQDGGAGGHEHADGLLMALHGFADIHDIGLYAQKLHDHAALFVFEQPFFDIIDIPRDMDEHGEEGFEQGVQDRMQDVGNVGGLYFTGLLGQDFEYGAKCRQFRTTNRDQAVRRDEKIDFGGGDDPRIRIENREKEDHEDVTLPDNDFRPLQRR